MVKVAVAGATTGVGKAVAKVLAAQDKYEYIILSRNASEDPKVVQVDYTDVDNIAAALEKHNVEAIISGLSLTGEPAVEAQNNLIEAADRASSVVRFIPSEYGQKLENLDNVSADTQYAAKLVAIDRLKKTGLKYTRLYNCFFMDYMAAPFIPSDQTYAPNVLIDLQNNFAALPGDGTQPFIMTHTSDIAKFAVAALDIEDWEPWYLIMGSRQTMLEAVKIAEEVKGVKFEVVFDTAEKLKASEVTLTPLTAAAFAGNDQAIAQLKMLLSPFSLELLRGSYDMEHDKTLNQKFPDIKALSWTDVVKASVKK